MASFVLYEALWLVIELQLGELDSSISATAWDLAQCAVFTTAVFAVNYFLARFRKGQYAGGFAEIACVIVVNSLLTLLIDNIPNIDDAEEMSFWNTIDIYIICVVSSLIAIINIQHAYHERFVRIKQEQQLNRKRLLQQQISPHFIFNSLSTLKGLIKTDPQRAADYVVTLSDITRYITENVGKDNIPISNALAFIRSYMAMLDCRFPNHFKFSIEDCSKEEARIVPVSLQIAIENAIKHNAHSCRQPLEILVNVTSDAVEVRNKKQPIAFAEGLGVGLENLNERYKMLIGKGLTINEDEETFTVIIPLIR